jgi:hypothetical protein
MPKDGWTDASREIPEEEGQEGRGTGIFVRAKRKSTFRGSTVDICELDTVSLVTWLRSRGEHNALAESVVCMLLGHTTAEIDSAIKAQGGEG